MRRFPKPDAEQAGEADERAIRAAALALLAGRDFGKQELSRRLHRRGFNESRIAAVVDGLATEGLLSDERFAEIFTAQRLRRGQGPLRIRLELRERGVPEDFIEAALVSADADWDRCAREVRARRFGAAIPGDYRQRAKQARFLQYRGFSAEQIRAALGGDEIEP
jgi:regulatory protein